MSQGRLPDSVFYPELALILDAMALKRDPRAVTQRYAHLAREAQ